MPNVGMKYFTFTGSFTWTDGSSGALFEQKAVWTGSALPTTTANLNDWVYMGTDGTWKVTGASSAGTATVKYAFIVS